MPYDEQMQRHQGIHNESNPCQRIEKQIIGIARNGRTEMNPRVPQRKFPLTDKIGSGLPQRIMKCRQISEVKRFPLENNRIKKYDHQSCQSQDEYKQCITGTGFFCRHILFS